MDTKELGRKVYHIVVEGVGLLYPQFIDRVNDIDIDYFENIYRDTEEIPEKLNFELRDIVLDDIKQYANQLLEQSGIKSQIEVLMNDTDADTANEALGYANGLIRDYVYTKSLLNGSAAITEEELQKMYIKAQRRNLWERITKNNKSDVIKFHHALMNDTYERCKDVLYESIESFLFQQ
jgi:hypothetical protein